MSDQNVITGVAPSGAADLATKIQQAKDAMQQSGQNSTAPGSPAALAAAGILPPHVNFAQAGEANALTDRQVPPANPSLAALAQNQQVAADSKEVGEKTYHSAFPGSSFFGKDGTRYEFDHKGELKTKDAELQKELDKIADKPGSPIYMRNQRMTPAPGDDEAVRQIQERAAQTMAELSRQRV